MGCSLRPRRFLYFRLAHSIIGGVRPDELDDGLIAEPVWNDPFTSDLKQVADLRWQLRTGRAKLAEELCNQVAEATNKRGSHDAPPFHATDGIPTVLEKRGFNRFARSSAKQDEFGSKVFPV